MIEMEEGKLTSYDYHEALDRARASMALIESYDLIEDYHLVRDPADYFAEKNQTEGN